MLYKVNQVSKKVNNSHIHTKTQQEIKMNKITTSIHIIALAALALNYFEIVYLYTIPGGYLVAYRAYTV